MLHIRTNVGWSCVFQFVASSICLWLITFWWFSVVAISG
jgi:hypothetical protein